MSLEVYESVEVLSSLGDFEAFKGVMIAKKRELEGTGTGSLKMANQTAALDTPEIMERIEELRSEGNDGYVEYLNTPTAAMWARKLESGDYLTKGTFELDLTAD